MRIALLGDTHFGVRNGDVNFHGYYEKFYDFFFDYLEEHNIDTVIQTGDFFENRRFINVKTLFLTRNYFLDKLKNRNIQLHTILGNHDVFHKDTNIINSPSLLLRYYTNIIVHDSFDTVTFDELDIDFVPWICSENKEAVLQQLSNSSSRVCVGHFEINGFEFYRGIQHFNGEYNSSLFENYELVISGHFHYKSSKSNIYYVGTPYKLTWADYDDERGFHIFDTETLQMSFIENPYTIFKKIVYDDEVQSIDFWNKEFDFQSLQNCLIKLLINNKKNPFIFDTVLDRIQKSNIIKLSIVDNQNSSNINNNLSESITVSDTITLLNSTIDDIDIEYDKNDIRKLLSDIYSEALNIGAVD